MREKLHSHNRTGRIAALAAAMCALLFLAAAAPAEEEEDAALDRSTAPACRLQGSWLTQVDIGGWFFTQYGGGANSTSGPLTIEWILFDPTLFGSFPAAVRVTQAAGGWISRGRGYDYTWVAYGLDAAGLPVYSIKGSGTGRFAECGEIGFDWVLEIFPWPMNPLVDSPVTCLSGHGTKQQIPVARATCP
jgi:hypothetical protein